MFIPWVSVAPPKNRKKKKKGKEEEIIIIIIKSRCINNVHRKNRRLILIFLRYHIYCTQVLKLITQNIRHSI